MIDVYGYQPDKRLIAESKEKRETSIASVVYDALSSAWGEKQWDDVSYKELKSLLRMVYLKSEKELGVLALPHKIAREYHTQIITTIMNQIPVMIHDLADDQLSDVYEQFAEAIPEATDLILRQALCVIESTPEQKFNRFSLARKLIDRDQNFFSQLSKFGFTMKDEIDIARRVSGKRGINVFEFAASAGGLTDAFRQAVFKEFSQGMQWYVDFKRLSPEEAKRFLQETDVTCREEVREILRVPPRQFGNERKIMPTFENRYEKDHPIDVDSMRMLSDLLHRAIEQTDPARAEQLQKKKEHEQVLFGSIVAAGELNSVTWASPIFLYLEGDEITPAIYKPQVRDVSGMRDGIPEGTYAQREWLAYQIDQSLGIDVIPPTILRDGPDGVGSVQEWVIAKTAAAHGKWETQANPDQLEDVAFDDVVKQNQDRHQGNFLIGYDGSVHAIDHGLILAATQGTTYIKSAPGFRFIGKPPSDRVIHRIQKFRSSPDIQQALRACFDAALSKDAEDAWKKFERGLEQLSPTDGLEGKYPFMHKGAG